MKLSFHSHRLTAAASLVICLIAMDLIAADKSTATEIRILQIQGTAELMPRGATTWVMTQTNQVLHSGDKLRTGNNSRVTLRWSDQSVVPFGALSEIEILSPEKNDSLPGLNVIKGVASFFHRDKPGRIRILTRGATASVEGTEFVMRVGDGNDPDRVALSVIDGKVVFANALGSVTLTNHEQAVAAPGQPPMRTAGFIANNILQWCFYYPGVLDLNDLKLSAEESGALSASLEAYRAGDLLGALAKYPPDRKPVSDSEKIYHAALLLAVGQVELTESELTTLSAAKQTDPLANSLRTLIAAVKRDPRLSTINHSLSTELLAASYHEQSRATGGDSLRNALDLARRATKASPEFGFAWARVAELEFGFGRTRKANAALDKALTLSPRNAQALALKGFILAGQNKIGAAQEWFDRAIAADGALGNAWLGRGLCRIRSGDAQAGREDLLVAAALEPQRSMLRSYLGKAYSDAGETDLANKEIGLAIRLDPNDPTGWLYSALLKQQQNRINEAIGDLEQSQRLNDNRALFRSQLLLDQDRAVRSSSLASIYRDNGMNEVSLREAASAVTEDYANYSAHLFLANSYDALRDPTRFNLRNETPWFNELLLANLLAPAGVATLSQNISQQEYSRMFERDGFGLATTTDIRGDGQYREVASQFGSFGKFSYSLDLDWQRNDGVRPNNELDRTEFYSQFKYQITPQDSVMLLTKFQDYHSGDNFQYFDPSASYRPAFNFDEYQKPILVGAYHREWSPGVHTLALAGRLINDQRLSDLSVPLFVFTRDTNATLTGVFSSNFNVDYRSQLEIWIGELNQIFKTDRNTLILGGRYQAGQFETRNELINLPFPGLLPAVNSTTTEDMQRWSVYAYDTWEAWPSKLWLTAGVSYDRLDYPDNFRQVPISSGQASEDCLDPKASLIWRPCSMATVRGAYSRSLSGVSLDESYRLEPSQLAGFNQSFRTIIPESVVGSVSAPKIDAIGAALDLKPFTNTYVGLVGEILDSDVDRTMGVYDFVTLGVPSSTPQQLRYREYSATLVANQLLSREWAVGLSYKFTRAELEQTLSDVPIALFAGARNFTESDLHNINAYLLYSHASGFFARVEASWYSQDNILQSGSSTANVTLPDDTFTQANLWLGWRFRKSLGDISIGVMNATDADYKLNPLNTYAELPRDRIVAARVRFRF